MATTLKSTQKLTTNFWRNCDVRGLLKVTVNFDVISITVNIWRCSPVKNWPKMSTNFRRNCDVVVTSKSVCRFLKFWQIFTTLFIHRVPMLLLREWNNPSIHRRFCDVLKVFSIRRIDAVSTYAMKWKTWLVVGTSQRRLTNVTNS